jgi:hypothetical protein
MNAFSTVHADLATWTFVCVKVRYHIRHELVIQLKYILFCVSRRAKIVPGLGAIFGGTGLSIGLFEI